MQSNTCITKRRTTWHPAWNEGMPSPSLLNPSTLRRTCEQAPATRNAPHARARLVHRRSRDLTITNLVHLDQVEVRAQCRQFPGSRKNSTPAESSTSLAMPLPWGCHVSSSFSKSSQCPVWYSTSWSSSSLPSFSCSFSFSSSRNRFWARREERVRASTASSNVAPSSGAPSEGALPRFGRSGHLLAPWRVALLTPHTTAVMQGCSRCSPDALRLVSPPRGQAPFSPPPSGSTIACNISQVAR